MSFTFSPKTEEEVKRVFEKGDYRFTVEEAEVKNDKNGTPMMHIKIQVFHNNIPGKTNLVDVWLTHNPNFEFLIRHFAYSIGLGECYEAGSLEPRQCKGKKGIVKLGITVDPGYPPKNKAIDFLIDTTPEMPLPADLNDDVPF